MAHASGIVGSGIDTVAMAAELSRMKAIKHRFSYYGADDISQEIWLSVNKSAPKFDSSKVENPRSFFNVVTENALKNLKRDKRIIDNINIYETPIIKEDNSFMEEQRARDLFSYLLANIPEKMQEPLNKIAFHGGEGVSQYIKTKIRTVVLKLLEKYYEDE